MEQTTHSVPSLVEHEQPCLRCGYSLKGLPIAGDCPECGTPVERSLRGDMLAYSYPDYVHALAKGSGLALLSMFLTLVVSILAAILMSQVPGATLVAQLLTFAVSAMFLYGWWKLTTPDLGQLTTNKGEKPRRIVRVTAMLAAAFSLVTIVLPAVIPFDVSLIQVLGGVQTVIFGVCLWAGMGYLRWLTPRIPHHKLYTRAGTLKVLLAIGIGLELLSTIISAIYVRTILNPALAAAAPAPGTTAQPMGAVFSSPIFWLMAIFGGVSGIFSLVVAIMYLIQMWSLRTQLKRVTREVDQQMAEALYILQDEPAKQETRP